jgi:tRNA/tmRNA/rRNA uracil-C5-methylase (TrmA/RlmC/RlmD family)
MEPVTSSTGAAPRAGDVLDLTAGEAVHGGWCVARQDADASARAGSVIFVRHALPGERIRAVVTQTTSKFARADAVEILAASPDRVHPPCPHARPGGCGGCDWQHASLPAQRELKGLVIRQQLHRIAGIDREVTVEELGDSGGLGWRTTVRFAVRADGAIGLRKHRSHELIEVGSCPIAHPAVTAAGVTKRRWPGARSVEVAVVPGSGERAVIITGAAGSRESVAQIAADSVLSAGRGGSPAALRGRGYLTQHVAGRDWRVGAGAFWQGHPGAADTLAAAVLEVLRPQPGDIALDLYCGAGLFAGVLAEAVGPSGSVIGIEQDAGAVRDARHNLRGTPWARVHKGDVAAVLGSHGLSGASLAVLDPPRTGLARPVIEALCSSPGAGAGAETPGASAPGASAPGASAPGASAPGASAPGASAPGASAPAAVAGLRRIAYVSCDPATLARDIAVFSASGWTLEALRAFDAFPMTHHVECLATLARG